MSKRNRNKFRSRENPRPAAVESTPIRVSTGSVSAQAQHTAEYKIISKDLIRLVVLNGLMLIAVLALYYVNKSSGIVEKLYSQLF